MPLPRLSSAGRLPKLGRAWAADKPLSAGGGVIVVSGAPPQIVPVYPNVSVEEQWVWEYITKRNPYWRQQVVFGNIREQGSTRTDFINDYYKAALYPEGIFVHRNRLARDLVKYSLVRQHGYRVYIFYFTDLNYVKRWFPKYYQESFN